MDIVILFFTGIIAGIFVSQIKKCDDQGPFVDIIFGIMGATLLGGVLGQLMRFSMLVMIIAVISAFLFIAIGRKIPQS